MIVEKIGSGWKNRFPSIKSYPTLKKFLRIASSLAIALVFTIVLHEFSYTDLSKKAIWITGSRDILVREIKKDFFFDRFHKDDTYVLEAVFFENYKGELTLNFLINGNPVKSFEVGKKVLIIDLPATFFKKRKNVLNIIADKDWRFKSLRLKNFYGYSSGFLSFMIINKNNDYRTPNSPQKSSFYSIFMILFFLSVFVLNLVPFQEKGPPSQKGKIVRMLRYVFLSWFILVLIIPLGTKYRLLLALRSYYYLVALYFLLLYFEEIKNLLKKAPKKFLQFVIAWQDAIVLFVITRLGIYGLGYLSSLVINKGKWFATNLPTYFLSLFFKWDSMWYLDIINRGYSFVRDKESNIAFFPCYPAVVKLSSFVVGEPKTNGFILSNLVTFLAVFYLVKLIKLEYGDEKIAQRAALYLLIFPASLFFALFYAEGLFLFLSIAAFYYMRKKKWLAASVFGFLSASTKIVGIFIVVPLIIEYFKPRLQSGNMNLNPIKIEAFSILLVPLGLLSYMAYCFFKFGDSLAFIHAHGAWNAKIAFPTETLASLRNLPPFYKIVYTGFVVFALLMIFVLILKKLRISYVVYSCLLLMAYLLENSLDAVPRQLSVVFPFYIGMALIGKNKLFHHFFVFASIALLTLFTILYANGYWFT